MKNILIVLFCIVSINCYAQKLNIFCDTVYKLHISLPDTWKTTYHYRGRDSTGVERIFYSLFGSDTSYEEYVSVLVGHENNTQDFLYNKNLPFRNIFKIVTVKPFKKNKTLSVKFKNTDSKYDTVRVDHYAISSDISDGMGTIDGQVIRIYFHFLCNDDVFLVAFSCASSKFEYYRPLFLKIANSVHFE